MTEEERGKHRKERKRLEAKYPRFIPIYEYMQICSLWIKEHQDELKALQGRAE